MALPALTPSWSPATSLPCGYAILLRRFGRTCLSSLLIPNLRNLSEASFGGRHAAFSPILMRMPSCLTLPVASHSRGARPTTPEMKPGVGERKWEVDSLCYPVRLAHQYWRTTHDTKPFGAEWVRAMHAILETFKAQQRKASRGPYHFQREAFSPYDTLSGDGYGNPARPVGLIYSGFRPSDDACIYPLNIPGNFFAVITLQRIEEMLTEIAHDSAAASEASRLRSEIKAALDAHARVHHPTAGEIWAYEIDAFGNAICMDDANVPSLLALPYLGSCSETDPMYLATRRFVLSEANPYFFRGSAAEGIGGPHIGQDMIWPMAIIMRALTTDDEKEQLQCIKWLKTTHAGTGFMHESFNKNDPANFTRAWFAWADTLFGELILKLDKTNPKLLEKA